MTRWLKVAAGAWLLLVPFAFVDWQATADALLSVSFVPLALALPLLTANMPLSAYKWDLLLHVQKIRPGLWVSLQAYWIGSFFSNYLPSNVSGDVVRLMVIPATGRRAEAASSILVERLTGLAVLVAFATLALVLRPGHFDAVAGVLPLLWLMVTGLIGAILITVTAGVRFANLLCRLVGNRSALALKLLNVVANVATALDAYSRRPGALVTALALSVPFYAVLVGFQYLVLASVEAGLTLAEVALIVPVVQLIGILPLAPNGLGLVEGAFVLFYVQAGVAPGEALAAALLCRLLSFLVSLPGGPLWLLRIRAAPELAHPERTTVPATEGSGVP